MHHPGTEGLHASVESSQPLGPWAPPSCPRLPTPSLRIPQVWVALPTVEACWKTRLLLSFAPSKSLLPTAPCGFLEPLLRLMALGSSHSKTENETRSDVYAEPQPRASSVALGACGQEGTQPGPQTRGLTVLRDWGFHAVHVPQKRSLCSNRLLAQPSDSKFAGESYFFPQSLSCLRLSATPWTVALQVPLSMGLSRQEYWSGLPRPPPGDLPHPGTEPTSPASPALQEDASSPGKPMCG